MSEETISKRDILLRLQDVFEDPDCCQSYDEVYDMSVSVFVRIKRLISDIKNDKL